MYNNFLKYENIPLANISKFWQKSTNWKVKKNHPIRLFMVVCLLFLFRLCVCLFCFWFVLVLFVCLFFRLVYHERLTIITLRISLSALPERSMQIRRKRFFNGRRTVPLERDCREIVLYSVLNLLKSVREGLSDGSALDCLTYSVNCQWKDMGLVQEAFQLAFWHSYT